VSIRPIKQVTEATPTIEGAGVQLRRAFGFGETGEFDPFLLFDDFRNESPDAETRTDACTDSSCGRIFRHRSR
jgi:redox-sensitive bicupin YhaK (pirin superfamily)